MSPEPLGVGGVNRYGERVGSVLWEQADDGGLVALVRLTSPEPD